MTMRSPRMTFRLMSRRTWKVAIPLVHVLDFDGDVRVRHLHLGAIGSESLPGLQRSQT